eukprot:9467104-Pyramimonas_sp.AAC.1
MSSSSSRIRRDEEEEGVRLEKQASVSQHPLPRREGRGYQQPAGFDYSVIPCWKIQQQAKAASCSIGLGDMLADALSDSALCASAAFGQLLVFTGGKMTAAVQ